MSYLTCVRQQWKVYRESGFMQPPGFEKGELLKPGSDEPRCWWAFLDTIVDNDYNLAAGRYKPQVTEAVSDDDPVDLIQEVLAIEKGIASGLEWL